MMLKKRVEHLEAQLKTETKQPIKTLEDFYQDVKNGSTELDKYYSEEVNK